MRDKISVIIPTYKRSNILLQKAIKSVLKQTYTNLELVVVDDNIVDSVERIETEKILNSFLETNKNIKYIKNNKNIGGALSRNVGIQNSTGKFIAFLDDDDEYLPEKIEKQYFFYKNKFKENEMGVIYCQAKILDELKNEIPQKYKEINGNKQALYEILNRAFTSTGCIFLEKKLLLYVGCFEKLICGQEWFLLLKILNKGYDCYSMSEKLLIYNHHSGLRITNDSNRINGEEKLFEIKKQYMTKLTEDLQNNIQYTNNISLAKLHIKISKSKSIKYILEAKKYKKIKISDILIILTEYLFDEKNRNKLKRIFYKYMEEKYI